MSNIATRRSGAALRRVLSITGLAALLAAVTTGIGFGATLWARHASVRSMGQLAVLGFAGTFLTGTLLWPMVRRLMEELVARRRTAREVPEPEAEL